MNTKYGVPEMPVFLDFRIYGFRQVYKSARWLIYTDSEIRKYRYFRIVLGGEAFSSGRVSHDCRLSDIRNFDAANRHELVDEFRLRNSPVL